MELFGSVGGWCNKTEERLKAGSRADDKLTALAPIIAVPCYPSKKLEF